MAGLTKSRYTQGVQCPKMLWMFERMPERFDASVLDDAALRNGSEVGDAAKGYFGDCVEVPYGVEGVEGMAEKTRELLEAGVPVVCEATFVKDGDLCMVDILRSFGDHVEVVEVKSSTEAKDIHKHDLAYQVWLLRECGLDVRRASLMLLDGGYVRGGELDLEGCFSVVDVTEEVDRMAAEVPSRAAALEEVRTQEEEPSRQIGMHCFKPHECGFRGWCWRGLPSPSVFDLSRMRKDRALALHLGGVSSFGDLVASGAFGGLTDRQRMQVAAEMSGEAHVDAGEIASFLGGLWFPLHFLDFESFQPAIPEFPGTRPYQQIPSQYSLHIAESADSPVEHREFLAEEGSDPRRALAERLVADIPADACVLAWNMGFEKGRIRELAEAFPDLAAGLMAIHGNVRDLMEPFQKGHYYTREMQGSASIKKVLPALFPDDPELDYRALEGVHNGTEASDAFRSLPGLPPDEAAAVREQLLRYCELDTLAMVRIWQKLREVAGR